MTPLPQQITSFASNFLVIPDGRSPSFAREIGHDSNLKKKSGGLRCEGALLNAMFFLWSVGLDREGKATVPRFKAVYEQGRNP